MPRRTSLADKIRQARLDAGMSQRALGYSLQLSDKAVSAYEVGRAVPTVDTLREISRLTEKPLVYFIENEDELDVDLMTKLRKIEKELQEVKQLLLQRTP